MNSLLDLYTIAAVMAFVAVACTALCLAWSISAWRRRLALRGAVTEVRVTEAGGLSGWAARVGSGLVSTGIAACAAVGWYDCYCVLTVVSTASR